MKRNVFTLALGAAALLGMTHWLASPPQHVFGSTDRATAYPHRRQLQFAQWGNSNSQ
jgi:hypothetical protein